MAHMAAEAGFSVLFDGPALTNGQMSVRDVAPALLALGELFAEASVIAYPGREPVALNIKATDKGSFDVVLILHVKDAWDAIVDIFTSDAATALANLTGIVGGSAGLLAFIMSVRRRAIKARETLPSGQIRVTLDDGTIIEVEATVLALFDNMHIRATAAEIVEPLRREGIDAIEFRTERGDPMVRVGDDDVAAFGVDDTVAEPLSDETVTTYVHIATAAFTEGNKWRLSSGDETFYAAIEDPAFLGRVDQGERFAKGDILRTRMRIVQSRGPSGIQTQRHVVEVLDHIPRERQLRLRSGGAPHGRAGAAVTAPCGSAIRNRLRAWGKPVRGLRYHHASARRIPRHHWSSEFR